MKECEQWDAFANRFMWPCARRAQVMSDPPDLSEAGRSDELSKLIETSEWAKGVEEMERDEEATRLWDQAYRLLRADQVIVDHRKGEIAAATLEQREISLIQPWAAARQVDQ